MENINFVSEKFLEIFRKTIKKVKINKEQYQRLIDEACKKIPSLEVYPKKDGLTVIFGGKAYPPDHTKAKHSNDKNIKSELLRDLRVVEFLCKHPPLINNFEQWCEDHGKTDSHIKSFFDGDKNVIKTDEIKQQLEQEYVESPLYLEYIYSIFRGQQLYNKYKILNDGKSEVSIKKWYILAMTNFLGFSNWESFNKAHPSPTKIEEESSIDHSVERCYTEFTGYYYDFGDVSIKDFQLSIDFGVKKMPQSLDTKSPNAKQKGLHHKNTDLEFFGNAYVVNNKWHVILWNEYSDHGDTEKIKIILVGGNKAVQESKLLKGLILATDSSSNPTSLEAVFRRNDFDYLDIELLRMHRYLMLWRNNIFLHDKTFSLNNLTAKNIAIDSLSNLVGVWHIMRHDENWNLVHSILEVQANYKITCYLYQNGRLVHQYCQFEPSRNGLYTVYISSKKNNEIVSQIVVHLPGRITDVLMGSMIFDGFSDQDHRIYPLIRCVTLQNINLDSIGLLGNDGTLDEDKVDSYLKLSISGEKGSWIHNYPHLEKSMLSFQQINQVNKVNVQDQVIKFRKG